MLPSREVFPTDKEVDLLTSGRIQAKYWIYLFIYL